MKLTKIETPPRLRIDTTVGTRVFAGDTMIYGDTGWRDITADLMNGWTASSIQIRRVGRSVQFRVYLLNGRDATDDVIFLFPVGFGYSGSGWSLPLTGGHILQIAGSRNARLPLGSTYFNGGYHMSSSVLVADPWPTTLPGTPA